MQIFGLVIMTGKVYRAERKQFAKVLLMARDKAHEAKADRDAANRHIERLLHNHLEWTLLWAAVRDCGVDGQVRVVYERLSPKEKGDHQ